MAKLVVGLGNPGREYECTRHNIAWEIFKELSFKDDLIWKEKFKGIWSSIETDEDKFYFLMPQTYMNLSGESVQPLCHFFKVERQDILVVHDELDLPFGTVAMKNGGGLAGHNGLKSIAACMGGNDFKRLRAGIGRPVHGSVSDWVLSKFSGDDLIDLETYLKGAARAIESYMKIGFDKAAGRYSKKNFIKNNK